MDPHNTSSNDQGRASGGQDRNETVAYSDMTTDTECGIPIDVCSSCVPAAASAASTALALAAGSRLTGTVDDSTALTYLSGLPGNLTRNRHELAELGMTARGPPPGSGAFISASSVSGTAAGSLPSIGRSNPTGMMVLNQGGDGGDTTALRSNTTQGLSVPVPMAAASMNYNPRNARELASVQTEYLSAILQQSDLPQSALMSSPGQTLPIVLQRHLLQLQQQQQQQQLFQQQPQQRLRQQLFHQQLLQQQLLYLRQQHQASFNQSLPQVAPSASIFTEPQSIQPKPSSSSRTVYGTNVAAACEAVNRAAASRRPSWMHNQDTASSASSTRMGPSAAPALKTPPTPLYQHHYRRRRRRSFDDNESQQEKEKRRQLSSRLTAWQSRERKRVEVEDLQERQQRLRRRNEHLHRENTELRLAIKELKQQGDKGGVPNTTTTTGEDGDDDKETRDAKPKAVDSTTTMTTMTEAAPALSVASSPLPAPLDGTFAYVVFHLFCCCCCCCCSARFFPPFRLILLPDVVPLGNAGLQAAGLHASFEQLQQLRQLHQQQQRLLMMQLIQQQQQQQQKQQLQQQLHTPLNLSSLLRLPSQGNVWGAHPGHGGQDPQLVALLQPLQQQQQSLPPLANLLGLGGGGGGAVPTWPPTNSIPMHVAVSQPVQLDDTRAVLPHAGIQALLSIDRRPEPQSETLGVAVSTGGSGHNPSSEMKASTSYEEDGDEDDDEKRPFQNAATSLSKRPP